MADSVIRVGFETPVADILQKLALGGPNDFRNIALGINKQAEFALFGNIASNWRSEPAAALRGFAKTFLPSFSFWEFSCKKSVLDI